MNLCVDSPGSRLPMGSGREHPGLKRETWATHLAEYPAPMGEVDGGSEEFRVDDLVYYDDPH
jgi:hypothetical protein